MIRIITIISLIVFIASCSLRKEGKYNSKTYGCGFNLNYFLKSYWVQDVYPDCRNIGDIKRLDSLVECSKHLYGLPLDEIDGYFGTPNDTFYLNKDKYSLMYFVNSDNCEKRRHENLYIQLLFEKDTLSGVFQDRVSTNK